MPSSTKIDTPKASHTQKDYSTSKKDLYPTPLTPSPPIKLKIINQFFPPDYAATGQLIEELARNLKNCGHVEF